MKCKKKNNLPVIKIIITLHVIVAIILFMIIIHWFSFKNTLTTPPVESNKIDSITKDNSKLIINVKHLDSIKNAKSIEVKSLDNDSTLKLFYQLIGK
jgi:hypothetical protein|nr:MAG TPA: hypothetical protein [Crassvirales sp.]